MPWQAADAGADRHADAVALFLAHVGETGILERLAGRIQAVDDEGIDLPLDLVIDALGRIEAELMLRRLHLAGDLAGIASGIEARDPVAPLLRPGCCASSSRRRRRAG
jgi:hypothetical protein